MTDFYRSVVILSSFATTTTALTCEQISKSVLNAIANSVPSYNIKANLLTITAPTRFDALGLSLVFLNF